MNSGCLLLLFIYILLGNIVGSSAKTHFSEAITPYSIIRSELLEALNSSPGS